MFLILIGKIFNLKICLELLYNGFFCKYIEPGQNEFIKVLGVYEALKKKPVLPFPVQIDVL